MPTKGKDGKATGNVIVLTFRGTESSSIKNWLTNLDFGKDPFPGLPSNHQVHQGFLGAYKDVKSQVFAALNAAVKQCANCRIILTGHSLGGALATIAAADLIVNKYAGSRLSLYTYGSPRVGNVEFVTWFNNQIKDSFRVTHADDAVTHVPLDSMGYTHVGFNVHYPNPFKFSASAADQKFCGWTEANTACQSKGIGFNIFKIGEAIKQHLTYLGLDCGCIDENIAAFRFKQAKLQNDYLSIVAQLAGVDTTNLSVEQIKEKLSHINLQ